MSSAATRMMPFGLALLIVATESARADERIMLSSCPAAVQKTIRREARDSQIGIVARSAEDGESTYVTVVWLDRRKYKIEVAQDGRLIDKTLLVDEQEVAFSAAPEPVKKTFKDEAKGAQIPSLHKEAGLGSVVYGAVVSLGGKSYEMKVAEDGTLTAKTLRNDEQRIELAHCPMPVRKTLNLEARNGRIGEIVRMSGPGGRSYVISVDVGDGGYSIEIAENGTLVSKSSN